MIIKISIARSILVCHPQIVRPSLPDILQPSMQTLKHITVNIYVDEFDRDVDLLFGIPSEFEDVRTKNIIETVTIRLLTPYASCCPGADWSRLDEVLTTPGWPSPKRVSLILEINSSFHERADVAKNA